MAAGDSCANCKHAGVRITQTPQGQVTQVLCRRNPPTVHAQFFIMKQDDGTLRTQEAANTYWPTVMPTDRCGEHAVEIATASLIPGSDRRS
jgi:hypothetical protein